MLSLTVAIFPGEQAAIRVPAEVELNDVLLASAETMPVFIRGKLPQLTDDEKLILRTAKTWDMVFEPTKFQYEAVINTATWEFTAVDTSERGI